MVVGPVSGLASIDSPPSHGDATVAYLVNPHSLTVAGAAQVLPLGAPVSRLIPSPEQAGDTRQLGVNYMR